MKNILVAFLLLLGLGGQRCAEENYPDALFKKWVHSYEEDAGDVEAYRPEGYNFPPSRGRRGMEFKTDGGYIRYDIAPTDGELPVPGKWEAAEGNRSVKINLQAPKPETYELQIITLEDSLLKVRRK